MNERLFSCYCEEYFGNDDLRSKWKQYFIIMYLLHPDHKWTRDEMLTRFKKIIEIHNDDCSKVFTQKIKELRSTEGYQQFFNELHKFYRKRGDRYMEIYSR